MFATAQQARRYGVKGAGAAGAVDDNPEAVKAELTRIAGELEKFGDAAQKSIKASTDLSASTKSEVDKLLVQHTDLSARLTEAEQKLARRGQDVEGAQVKSAGHQLIDDIRFKSFVENQTRGVISIAVKAPMLSAAVTSGVPGVLMPQQLPGILPLLRQRLFLRGLISPGTTGAAAIAYVRQTGFTNAAAIVAEGTVKPQSGITFDTQIVHVATLAHIFKAAKQLLDDFAGLQSTVDDELRFGIAVLEEAQLLYGDGTGLNLHGIIPQASVYVPAFVPANLSRIDTLRLAMLQAVLAKLPATGIVLHPTDWARIELTKDAQGGYIWSNPVQLGTPTMWGLPIVETPAIVEGTFLTGAFQGGAQIFDREQVNVVVATQNEDDFVRNLITIRCEERLALAIKRPESFITGPFVAA
jgi:HK97 family phage major capsid protein